MNIKLSTAAMMLERRGRCACTACSAMPCESLFTSVSDSYWGTTQELQPGVYSLLVEDSTLGPRGPVQRHAWTDPLLGAPERVPPRKQPHCSKRPRAQTTLQRCRQQRSAYCSCSLMQWRCALHVHRSAPRAHGCHERLSGHAQCGRWQRVCSSWQQAWRTKWAQRTAQRSRRRQWQQSSHRSGSRASAHPFFLGEWTPACLRS